MDVHAQHNNTPEPAAKHPDAYVPLLLERQVGLVVNQTSVVEEQHLLDMLLDKGISVKKIFAPEHGFRGEAGAGEMIRDGKDPKTGIAVLSLYGSTKKPTSEMLEGIDMMVFDIQDVGVRFYTYISTMHYVMEACAEHDIPLLILDRPNPNGYYVDGPVLNPAFSSFVGMHPIPVVHGLTVGELARMINGEGWLTPDKQCDLTVIECRNYTHSSRYRLPVSPSPNLPNNQAINLYPSLCLFEGTAMSVGRGTPFPFQVVGYPDPSFGQFSFIPESIPGKSLHPKHENKVCYGIDLSGERELDRFEIDYLIDFYTMWHFDTRFFNDFFDNLAGSSELRKQIEAGLTEDEIRFSWKPELESYKALRRKYLLYPDFE